MAQSVSKPCEICMGGPGKEFCIDCEQHFCMNCKTLHKRMKGTKNHEFQSGENVVPEVKLRCEEHKEDFIFRCDNCAISVCVQCVTGKHKGHTVSSINEFISDLKKTVRNEMKSKLDVFQTNKEQIEGGLTTFDLNVTSVIKGLTEEGSKLKAMVDRHIEKMIATLKEKAGQEKEPLTKMLLDYKQLLEQAKELEKRENKIRQSREDASIIQHLQILNDDITKLSIVPSPVFPSVKYSPKTTSDSDVDQLIGTYSLSKTQTNKPVISPASSTVKVEEEKHGRLYRCNDCGYTLTAVTYGNGGHFTSSIKIQNVWHLNDGLREYHMVGSGLQKQQKPIPPPSYRKSHAIYVKDAVVQ